jgi:hypothetical protein
MGHAGPLSDYPIGLLGEPGDGEQGEQHTQATCLEGPARRRCDQGLREPLTLDPDQQRRVVQEGVAGGIDELESERAQTLRQGRGDVVRHQQGIGTTAAELVYNRPEQRRPQTALGLHAVAHLAPLPA